MFTPCILAVDQFAIDEDKFSILKLSSHSLGWDDISLYLSVPQQNSAMYISGLTESPSVSDNQVYFFNLTCVYGDW